MIATGDTCGRAAIIVALLAPLWAVGVLWVSGTLRDDLDAAERDEVEHLRQRAERAERILAALREPRAKVDIAGRHAYTLKLGDIYADEGRIDHSHQLLAINAALRAAVTAAEQAVDHA